MGKLCKRGWGSEDIAVIMMGKIKLSGGGGVLYKWIFKVRALVSSGCGSPVLSEGSEECWIEVKRVSVVIWEVKCPGRYLQMAPGWEGTSLS